jgi:glycosyltransferase involved in cell wall biosynthesis
MRIIININLLLNKRSGNSSYLPVTIINELISKKPEHEFVIITDHAHVKRISAEKNVTIVIVKNTNRHPLIWKWWYDLKLPAILKKFKADVFVSFNGFCSMTTSVPQCVMLHDLSFLYDASRSKRSHLFFYNRFLPKFLQKANIVVSPSSFLKREITIRYKINPDKIEVVPAAPYKIFHPVSEIQKEETRIKHSDGKNYFISVTVPDADKNLITLLKAFSVFKKLQKSKWKLILTDDLPAANKKITETLKSYKYRDDVLLVDILTDNQLVMMVGSAYALIDTLPRNDTDVTVLNAMKCHVPVITSNESSKKELYGAVALYADTADHKDIADKMMLLYKDETLHGSLIEKSKILATENSLAKAIGLLWQSIDRCYSSTNKSQP